MSADLSTLPRRSQHIGASPIRLQAFVQHCRANNVDTTNTNEFRATTGIFIYHEHLAMLGCFFNAGTSGNVMTDFGFAKQAEVINPDDFHRRLSGLSVGL